MVYLLPTVHRSLSFSSSYLDKTLPHSTTHAIALPLTTIPSPVTVQFVVSPPYINFSTSAFWIDSKDMKMMPCPGTTRPRRGTSPRRKAWGPSCARILEAQSIADLYLAASSPGVGGGGGVGELFGEGWSNG